MQRLLFGALLLAGMTGCSPGILTADHGGLGGQSGSRPGDPVGGGAVGDSAGGGIEIPAGVPGSEEGKGAVSSPKGDPYGGRDRRIGPNR